MQLLESMFDQGDACKSHISTQLTLDLIITPSASPNPSKEELQLRMIHRRLNLSPLFVSSLSLIAHVAAGSVQCDDLASVLISEDILVTATPQVIGTV